MPDATVRLIAAPASLKPTFSFGCGKHDGSALCDLGALDANSAQRQLQAKIAVAASATTVTSVRLTAIASVARLAKDPQASATTSVSAAATSSAGPSAGAANIAPLTVGNLPYLPSASPVLSPGGNAAGLFPALTPSANPPAVTHDPQKTRTVANTSALPLGAHVIGAQLAGLAVLALAFVLAVARLSLRRRSAPAKAGSAALPQPRNPSDPPGHR